MSSRQSRLTTFRAAISSRNVDGALVSHPSNRRYLTGFSAADSSPGEPSAVALVDSHSSILLTAATNAPWAQAEAADWQIVAWQRPWTTTLAERIIASGWTTIGFEERAMSVAVFRTLQEAVGPRLQWVAVDDVLTSQRATKDAHEMIALRAALALTDDVYAAVSRSIRPGQTEREVAWFIEREFRDRGGDGPAFATIVAAGPNAARPHHASGDRRLQEGEPIIIDMGACVDGYNGDLTRTVCFGPAPDRLCEVYNAVNRANRAAIASAGPGVPVKDVDGAARTLIREAGFGDFFVHSLGHGLGLQVHEAPSLNESSNAVLQVGQVFTIEPGVYIPEWGGVRIEDVAVVIDAGCSVLTTAAKQDLE